MSETTILGLWVLITGPALFFFATKYFKQRKYLKKYTPLIKVDEELVKLNKQKTNAVSVVKKLKDAHQVLQKEIKMYSEESEMISFGFYTPKYDFKDSATFKTRLQETRQAQKDAIKKEKAVICTTAWEVDGSKAKGRKLAKKIIKLGLNAYNVQCDNAILKVSPTNITQSEERLDKIRDNIDKLLEGYSCSVDKNFHKWKHNELHLAYEYQQKVAAEKEEQRQIREQMKEEEKVKRDIEKAQREAEKEEVTFEKALNKAREEMAQQSDGEKAEYAAKVAELERQLQEAHEKKDRALSQAQQTKRGHVYVISNIGSFGENVYKIGMTRRLEPMDRVKELGDASVPFSFDVHAMIFSENAPELEKKLHGHFTQKRLNQVNHRKEFFQANLEEIKQQCDSMGATAEFTMLAEAQGYRETVAMKQDQKEDKSENSMTTEVDDLLKEVA